MIKVCVYFNFGEAQTSEIGIDPRIKSTGCLPESIQCTLEYAHMQLYVKGPKSLRLLNIHLLLNKSIEECCLHIHLVDLPSHLR